MRDNDSRGQVVKWVPNWIFKGDKRYGAQLDMCHLGIVGSGIPRSSIFWTNRVAGATFGPSLLPLVAQLNEHGNLSAAPWCSMPVVVPLWSEAMGLHTHLRDGVPMAPIVCMGTFKGGIFFGGGLLNPYLTDKKRHTRVHKGFGFPLGHARPH